jgi:hypothetical protein
VRCFRSSRRRRKPSKLISSAGTLPPINKNDIPINELRVEMAMTAIIESKTSICESLPPTHDSLFHHCLRVCRQIQIWLQAPDGYINYPDFEDSGFEMIDGRLQIKWTSKLPFSNDPQLTCCGKHKGACIRCVCILNQLPCTIFCRCPTDCPNRKLNQTPSFNAQKKTVSLLLSYTIY